MHTMQITYETALKRSHRGISGASFPPEAKQCNYGGRYTCLVIAFKKQKSQ